MTSPRRVALVVPGLAEGGGVPAVAAFLRRIIDASGRYRAETLSLAMSSRDPASVRLRSPLSWIRGVRVQDGRWDGAAFRHVGSVLAELEPMRYRPRRRLTELLDGYDLVQVVAGAPAWARVARHARPPLALQVATLVGEERKESLGRSRGPLAAWRRWMTRIVTRIEREALADVDAIFVENRWMYDLMRQRVPAGEVLFAPPGVDDEIFTPADSPESGDRYILSVGRLSDPRKRVSLLFEAYARLRKLTRVAPRLVLAGSSGPSNADWERARELGIAESVEFHEGLPQPELAALYRGATAYVLSSDEEGLGIVILEAMASGVPVVSTDCGGPATSVVDGETGYLVPRGDAAAIAERLAAIAENPTLRERLGRNARRRAVERFSHAATGRLFLECYDRLLASKHGGARRS